MEDIPLRYPKAHAYEEKNIYNYRIINYVALLGATSVLSDDCVSIILERDTLKVGESFFVYPLNAKINHNLSTGTVELVAVNGNYNIYTAKCSGTIVFESCEGKATVRIFPKKNRH